MFGVEIVLLGVFFVLVFYEFVFFLKKSVLTDRYHCENEVRHFDMVFTLISNDNSRLIDCHKCFRLSLAKAQLSLGNVSFPRDR